MGSRKTIKKEKFAHKYVECGNASEAYRFAYDASRMKPASVRRVANELLKDLYVSSTVKAMQEEFLVKLDLSAEKVIRELARIAFFDPRRLVDKDGRLRAITELEAGVVAAISSLEVINSPNSGEKSGGTEVRKIKLNDKLKALDALSRHLGLYEKNRGELERTVIVKDFTGCHAS